MDRNRTNPPRFPLLCLCLDLAVFVIEKHKTKQEHAEHHGKGAGIVRIGGQDESFILGVFERSYGHLSGAVQMRVADSIVVDHKLEHTVHVGQFEASHVQIPFLFECRADERIHSYEFQLNVVGIERHPLTVAGQRFNLDLVFNILFDCVRFGWLLFTLSVMFNRNHTQHSRLFGHPIDQRCGQLCIATGGGRLGTVELVVEKLVTQQIQRSGDKDTGIVSCLDGGHQDGILSHGIGSLEEKKEFH